MAGGSPTHRNGPPRRGGQSRRGGAQRRPAPVDPARRVAYDVIHAVSTRESYANLALAGALREAGLAGRDAAFATELTHGTLRWQGTYDAVLERCVDRALGQLDAAVLDVLRLGTHQVLGMRVPTHAAVATSVELARAVGGRGVAGLVNAVLRKVSANDLEGWLDRVAPAESTDPVGRRGLVHAHPRWIVEALAEALGDPEAELDAALAADNVPAEVSVASWPGRSTVDELVAAGARPGRWSPVSVTVDGDPHDLAAVAEHRAGVQDEGSQLMALALSRAPVSGPDRRWLDLCAGPGGKAALLAGLAAGRDARVLAGELQPHRAGLVARSLLFGGTPAPGALGVVAADGTRPPWRAATFDRVLVDAPCTGLGALRRRPEARWRRRARDVASLTGIQRDLLASALRLVRPGGVVAYVTCSPHQAETVGIVEPFVAAGGVETVDAASVLPEVDGTGPGPWVQLWPHRHGTDAMYLALLRRTGTD